MWEEMVIHMVLGLLKSFVKNPAKADALQGVLLEVRDGINELYPGK